jgi:uncharacterized protein YfcZ (UPF0381/DUF406 family)
MLSEEDESAAIVCCALAIHAIIRANDAVTLKFLQIKSTRHDDASALFSKLVKKNKIPEEDIRFLALIERATADKSGADYGKSAFTYEDAKRYVEEAQEFVSAMKMHLE